MAELAPFPNEGTIHLKTNLLLDNWLHGHLRELAVIDLESYVGCWGLYVRSLCFKPLNYITAVIPFYSPPFAQWIME